PIDGDDFPIMAGDAIEELIAIGDSSNNILDFYFVDQKFSGSKLQLPLPYLKARSTTASPNWIINKKDLTKGGLSLARNIWKLYRDIWISYGLLTGSCTSTSSNLVDTGAAFKNGMNSPGDRVINITQNKAFTIEEITSDTTIVMNNDDSGNWTSGDDYIIQRKVQTWSNTGTSTETDLWSPVYAEARPGMDATQVGYYGDMILALYEKPVQQQSFTIGAPKIKDGNGSLWPLWRVFMGESFYFRMADLYPAATVFSESDDRSRTFMAIAMDYSYKNNKLRIVPSSGDRRLDVLLAKALAGKEKLNEIISIQRERDEANR
ncbi:MAG: hypothetical protein ACXADB_12710, partial [Candidatus Hermodarchaeia archaeon]